MAGELQGAAAWVSVAREEIAARRAAQKAKVLSEDYNCNISVVEPNTCVVLLEQDKVYFKVLDSNGNIGWIYCCDDFSRYFKIVKE